MNKQELLDKLVDLENISFDYDRLSRRSFKRYITDDIKHELWYSYRLISKDLIGYYLLLFYKEYAKLYSIAINPKFKGQGYGQGFVNAALSEVRFRDKKELRLECKEELRNFYTKLGFEEYGKEENYYTDGSAAIKFRKAVGTSA